MLLSFTETLAAPSAALFAVLSVPERRPEWQSSLLWARVLSGGPTGVGTRWHERTRFGVEFTLEVVAHEAPSRWSERVTGNWGEATLELSFEPVGAPRGAPAASGNEPQKPEQTLLGVALKVAPEAWWHRPARWLAPAVRVLLRNDLRRAARLARNA